MKHMLLFPPFCSVLGGLIAILIVSIFVHYNELYLNPIVGLLFGATLTILGYAIGSLYVLYRSTQ